MATDLQQNMTEQYPTGAAIMDYSGTCEKCGAEKVTVTAQSLCLSCAASAYDEWETERDSKIEAACDHAQNAIDELSI